MHPKLKARRAWAGHQGELPVIEGTLVKLTVEHLPVNLLTYNAVPPRTVRGSWPATGFYRRLGFVPLAVDDPGPVVYLGRKL